MLKNDYLMEMIGAMCRAVSEIIFKRSKKEYAECHALANDQYQSLLGMSLGMILSLPSETVFDLLGNFGEIEPKKILTLVDLLKEDSEVFKAEDDEATADAIREKCEDLLNLLDRYDLDDDVLAELDKRMSAFGID